MVTLPCRGCGPEKTTYDMSFVTILECDDTGILHCMVKRYATQNRTSGYNRSRVFGIEGTQSRSLSQGTQSSKTRVCDRISKS